jgi:hypothetical protein
VRKFKIKVEGDLTMSVSSPILLLGSVPLKDAETVFRTLAEKIGTKAPRYPDGETGVRGYWIRWQRRIFDDNPSFKLHDPRVALANYQDKVDRPFFKVTEGLSSDQISYPPLGFAEEAVKSYALFSRLQAEGIVPRSTRLQVALPTAAAIVSGFVVFEDRVKAEPALERAMKKEVEEIVKAIPASELAIQWDVCFEIVGHDGGYKLHYDDVLQGSIDRVCRHVSWVPANVEVGIHLCYGDPGHKHIVEPKDAGTSVAFANGICGQANRGISFIHIPIPRGWVKQDFYAPLSRLRIPRSTELYLGPVHFTDGIEGTRKRANIARGFVPKFGVATECGFGRRDPATIPKLLELLDEVAA